MEGLSKQEYPAMLERLPPAVAVSKFSDRVIRINKVSSEIAEWLKERRKVEELYVQGLKKLARRPVDVGGDLGVFEAPWRKIVGSTEDMAKSHALFTDRVEKDVEMPLRMFSSNKDMMQLDIFKQNLNSMAKELEDAQEKSDKLARKGGKASAMKVDAASTRLVSANSQWDSQAPFIYEQLQEQDERRLNHLRDVLTQYETHEAEQLDRCQKSVESTLGAMLEIDTHIEIISWATSVTAGKQVIQRQGRQQSTTGSSITAATPPRPTPTPRSTHTDDQSEHSTKQESGGSGESKIRSRFGTMLGKRRQSVVGGFRAPSPSKGGFVAFGGRNTPSRDGRPSPSPRHSSNNLRASPTPDNRLSSLAESPPAMSQTFQTNGDKAEPALISDSMHERTATMNGSSAYVDVSDVAPPPGPPPSQIRSLEPQTDAEGYTVPAAMNDAISLAQFEAADGEQPQFKLDIRPEPIQEQDADSQAALSSVANTLRLSSMTTPNRKAGTVRGRRDVRNTVYVPSANSLDVSHMDSIPPSPGIPAGRAAALAALGGEPSAPSASDTTSIRSGHSLTAHNTVKHMDMHGPGLNASIVETISATLENGVFTSAKINGEIALMNNKIEDDIFPSSSEVIRINDFANLEAIGPNRTFIHPSSTEKADEFTIDIAAVSSSKPSVAFTYRVHIDETSLSRQGPLLLKAAWKPQDDKLGLVLEYSLNPACGFDSITVNNLVLVAIYQGTRGSACQTKPTGTHIKEKSLVYWRLGDMTLEAKRHKIVARIIGQDGVAPEPGHIEARWEINGASSSGIGSGITISKLLEAGNGKGKERELSEDDPFADESLDSVESGSGSGRWVDVETNRKFVSGKYEAR